MASDIALIPLEEAHLDDAVALSREAGWPHRREDWAMSLALSKGIALVRDGVLVGTALLTPFGEAHATINMVIVAAAERGHGLGRRLMEAALEACGARECRLIATREGLPLYEKYGFRTTGAIFQHQGIPEGLPTDAPADGLRPARAEDLARLVEIDRAACGMARGELLGDLFGRGRLLVADGAEGITGFSALRDFGRGRVLGPIVARDDATARALFLALATSEPAGFLRVDTSATSGFGPWLAGFGLAHAGGGITMTRPGARAPTTDAPSLFVTFALVSQAFG